MARIRADYVFGTTTAAIDADDTTLSSAGLANLPTIAAPNYAAIVLHNGTDYETVHVTAHAAAATTATIARAREGSTASAWPSGTDWLHGPTTADLGADSRSTGQAPLVDYTPTGSAVNVDNSADHQGMPSAVTLRDGTLVTVYRHAPTHTWSSSAVSKLRTSTDDGATWSAATTVVDGAGDDAMVCIAERRDGTLVGLVVVRPTSTQSGWSAACITSADAGATWSAYNTIDVGYADMEYPADIVETADGTLLGAFYGRTTSGGLDYAVCGASTDGGVTWQRRSVIAQDSDYWQEPQLVVMPDGEILCFLRWIDATFTTRRIYLSRSVDNGHTWTTPEIVATNAGGQPTAHLTRNGLLVVAFRDFGNSERPAWAVSADRGNTWETRTNWSSDTRRYVYAGWLDLSDGDLGVSWAQETWSGSEATDADVFFMRFTRGLPLEHLDSSAGSNGDVVTKVGGVWTTAAPSLGGGSGVVKVTHVKLTTGNISFTTTGWQNVSTATDLTFTGAQVGDIITYSLSARTSGEANSFAFDVATVVGGSPVNYFASGGSATGDGVGGWYAASGVATAVGGDASYTVQSGDLSGGTVTLRLRVRPANTTSRLVRATSDIPLQVSAQLVRP